LTNHNHRFVVTGLGAITPLGLSVRDYWQGLVNGKCAVSAIRAFDTTSFPIKVAGEVKGFEPGDFMDLKRADRAGRCTQFAIAATAEAVKAARLEMSREDRQRVGVALASSGMISILAEQNEILNKRGPLRVDPLFINKVAASMVPTQVALETGARGPNTSLNSACASGSDAIGNALNFLRLGYADVMITGGGEAQIKPIVLAGTGIVGALTRNPDPATASRPFDKDRDGFVFAEGSGILILETLEHASGRGAPILAELAGAGWSFDCYNDTAPYDEQQAAAMQSALDNAGISPDEVDYINAHGTSTRLNDAAETRAIKMVFGERAYKIPVSSNKSMIGHLACAAGAAEAVAAVMTVKEGIIPPTANYHTPDPECDLDYVPNEARRREVKVCLSNSFGMGGQNCSLVFKRFEE
jgi:3-oxoacyl-[acyl-carrier-protein] synthase II